MSQKVKTRVFDIARRRGISLRQLAKSMDLDLSTLSRIRSGERGVSQTFIAAAQRAFPYLSLSELFYVESDGGAGGGPEAEAVQTIAS